MAALSIEAVTRFFYIVSRKPGDSHISELYGPRTRHIHDIPILRPHYRHFGRRKGCHDIGNGRWYTFLSGPKCKLLQKYSILHSSALAMNQFACVISIHFVNPCYWNSPLIYIQSLSFRRVEGSDLIAAHRRDFM